jgi:hypothetical protein
MAHAKPTLLVLFSAAALLQGATDYKVTARYPVPGNGSFDYVTIDSAARRIYVSHGTQVDVVDADSGKVVGTIADTPGVHGAAIASEFKHRRRRKSISIPDRRPHNRHPCRSGSC